MNNWQFCFISDQYYKDFPDKYLMRNKESHNGVKRDRPCFLAFRDTAESAIFWLVPISSSYAKYRNLYDKKTTRYGKCNTIRFGEVLGKPAAFLIQNICPVTERYIREIYVDKNKVPIRIDDRIVDDVIRNAKEVLSMSKNGLKLVFPDIGMIYEKLCKNIQDDM